MPLAASDLAPLPGPPARVHRRPERASSRVATRRAAVVRPLEARTLAWSALALVLLLEVLVLFAPQGLLLHGWQQGRWAKAGSGYAMVALLVFAMAFGWLRRLPALAPRLRRLNELHHAAGLLLLLLLACHAAARPQGFVLLAFHAMTVGQGAGALRALLGARAGRQGGTVLLMLHVALGCLACGAALLHLWFVYAYTA